MHHFGVVVPSTNTIVEVEYGRLLPPTLQVHVARIPLLSRGGSDTDVDYQARLLGSAKVEVVALAQTGATLSPDDYDERITKRMSEAAGVPAVTSAKTYDDTGDSGQPVHRRFCPNCGSGVVNEVDVLPGVTIVLAGTLDDPAAFKPTMDVYWSSAQPWVHTSSERTRFPKMPD